LQQRDGNEEPAADDDGEDPDDEAAHEEQRRLPRKQPGRERANPREIHDATSPRRQRRYAPPSPSAPHDQRILFLCRHGDIRERLLEK
jgi:hypothetical protein